MDYQKEILDLEISKENLEKEIANGNKKYIEAE